ncbi:MAG: phosphatidylserine decarboxylase [Planctomycetota bacterium]
MLTTRYAPVEITLIVLVGAGLTMWCGYYWHYWAILPALLGLALLSFYRNPPRQIPAGDNLLVAPADGKVVEISREITNSDSGAPRLRIMIFLSVFDVHVNRSPCAGRVTEVNYAPGEFLNALRPEADTRNESNTLHIEPRAPIPGPIRVRQIAGVLARRIVCHVSVGTQLATGQRFGMIKLGSRTELCLPESPDWELTVGVGDTVRAGHTVLARWHRGNTELATDMPNMETA